MRPVGEVVGKSELRWEFQMVIPEGGEEGFHENRECACVGILAQGCAKVGIRS